MYRLAASIDTYTYDRHVYLYRQLGWGSKNPKSNSSAWEVKNKFFINLHPIVLIVSY